LDVAELPVHRVERAVDLFQRLLCRRAVAERMEHPSQRLATRPTQQALAKRRADEGRDVANVKAADPERPKRVAATRLQLVEQLGDKRIETARCVCLVEEPCVVEHRRFVFALFGNPGHCAMRRKLQERMQPTGGLRVTHLRVAQSVRGEQRGHRIDRVVIASAAMLHFAHDATGEKATGQVAAFGHDRKHVRQPRHPQQEGTPGACRARRVEKWTLLRIQHGDGRASQRPAEHRGAPDPFARCDVAPDRRRVRHIVVGVGRSIVRHL
jgi:hypothetical protein